MVRKVVIVMLFLGIGFLGLLRVAQAAENASATCGWTNLHFAEFLAQKNGIKVDEKLSQADKYKALANALSQQAGIKYFLNTKPTDNATCCGVADTLYAKSGAKEDIATCDLKINYLIKNGLLKLPASESDPCKALCQIEEVETFTPPIRRPPGTNPPGPDPERPSSRI